MVLGIVLAEHVHFLLDKKFTRSKLGGIVPEPMVFATNNLPNKPYALIAFRHRVTKKEIVG